MRIEINTKDLKAKIQAFHGLSSKSKGVPLAASRAINRAGVAGGAVARREVARRFNVTQKAVTTTITTSQSNSTNLTYSIKSGGRPLPVDGFRASVVTGSRRSKNNPNAAKGVSVAVIRGQRRMIKNAFFATMKSGKTSVFARGQYVGRNFIPSNTRTMSGRNNRLQKLYTITAPNSLTLRGTLQPTWVKVKETFVKRFEHELTRLIRQATR